MIWTPMSTPTSNPEGMNGTIVFEGDSTTAGTSGSPWPSQAMAAHPNTAWFNVAAGGDEISEINAAGAVQVTQYNPDVVFYWAGTNDLVRASVTGKSAADMYAEITAWLTAVRAAITTYVVDMTIVPMTATAMGTPQAQLDILTAELNALRIANSAGFDKVIDIATDASLLPGTVNRAADGIHYTAAGDTQIVTHVAGTIAERLALLP